MTTNSILTALSSLQDTPTTVDWELVLQGALSGVLDDLIERLGSIEDLIHTLQANSTSRTMCQIAFRQALENLVVTWQPAAPTTFNYLERVLHLISAYTPISGFHKVLGHLIRWGTFTVEGDLSASDAADLDSLALLTLNNYFPTYPSDPASFPAFTAYISFLADRANTPHFRGPAARRLIELGNWNIDDPIVAQFLEDHFDDIIPSFIPWLLGTPWHRRSELFSILYSIRLRRQHSFTTFEQELTRASAHITSIDPSGPALVLYSGEMLYISLTGEALTAYVRQVLLHPDIHAETERALAAYAGVTRGG